MLSSHFEDIFVRNGMPVCVSLPPISASQSALLAAVYKELFVILQRD
jgi:hypothetical protein